MSLNHVVLSGKISKPPRRIQQEDGRVIYVFPLAVRTPRISFPIVVVENTLPHFVAYYGERPLTDQPTISLVGASIITRNVTFEAEDVARMLRKAGADGEMVERLLKADGLRIKRVVTEVWVRPEGILPGGEW